MGCDKIVIDMHAGFSGEIMFWRMGCDIYMYCDEWYCCVCLICVESSGLRIIKKGGLN